MRTIGAFYNFVELINKENSRNYKIDILKRYKDDATIRYFLNFVFNPFVITGISAKKFERAESLFANRGVSVFQLMEYLQAHHTGKDEDLIVVKTCLNSIPDIYHTLLEKVITKNLPLGIDAKTINKVIPGFLPQFACMLAEKYFEKPEKLEGKEFAITTKLDGFRLIVFKNADGSIECYSRVGQPVEGLVEIEAGLATLPCNTALDGELTITNYFDMPSKEAYKAASKIIRLKGDTPKRGLTYRIFDCMTVNEFKTQSCIKPYVERRAMLDSFPKMPNIEVLPVLYIGDDTSKITEWLDKITAGGGEGIILNDTSALYQWRRTWALQKVKKFQSLDLEVIDLEEGSGRLAGTLGAILVRYKGGNSVRVGSGFSDEERLFYWANPDLILHKVVEIKFFEESTNADGTFSLRFPTWVSNIRDPRDKANPDF